MPEISVIVPVYNTEQFLSRCIESILKQSFTDFELLLVDDGSTDGSGAVCDAYAEKDERIRVFHKENGGVSSARNVGLRNIKGQFVVFVDADDWVKEQYLEHLMCDGSDLVVAGIQEFGGSDALRVSKEQKKVSICELKKSWSYSADYFSYIFPVAKRFVSSVIFENGLLFNECLFFSEDFCFVLDYLGCVNTAVEIPFADYQYRMMEISRDDKYKMTAQQLVDHYEAHARCFDKLGADYSVKAVRDDMNVRLVSKFLVWLSHCDSLSAYRRNALLFRKQQWAKEMLGHLTGKKGKRIGYGAYYCPTISYCIERLACSYRKLIK